MVEMITDGTDMITEFIKYGRSPSQRTPMHACDHASRQCEIQLMGQVQQAPVRISARSFREVDSTT